MRLFPVGLVVLFVLFAIGVAGHAMPYMFLLPASVMVIAICVLAIVGVLLQGITPASVRTALIVCAQCVCMVVALWMGYLWP